MSKKTVKLQNIILQYNADANLSRYPNLMHTSALNYWYSMVYDPDMKCHIIRKYDVVDFAFYFNTLQLKNWKTHTYAENFKLKLTFKGKAVVEFTEFYRNSKNINRGILKREVIESDSKTDIVIDIPETDKTLVSFTITALEDFFLYEGSYVAEVEEENIRDVRISLASTTFRKEAYIKKNIQLLKENVFCEESDIKDDLFVHIIDNGRTLDPEEFDCENLKIYPNANVGGAGGFTRGMIEALAMPNKPDYVLLMDDDVLIMSESLFRTFYLLRILKPEYHSHFVSGAMFDYDIREKQYEDVGYVHANDASYGPLKDRLDMNGIEALLNNEEMANRSQNHSYAGWWYCCIPVHKIEENGLPLPVFIRGDDVEFSIRNKAQFLTLNGISIWHVGFAGKFNAAMELYQVHRNSFVIQASSDICKDIDFLKRIKTLFWKEITRFAYNNAEQLIDSVDDFLKGPEFLKTLNGEQCLKEHAGKNDKLIPISDFPPEYNVSKGDPYSYKKLNRLQKLIYKATVNGHLLPGFMLRRWPVVIAFDWFFVPGKNYMRKRLIAVNPNDNTACMREMNRKRCFSLISRYRKVMKKYKKTHVAVEQAYRKEFANMTTEKFWKEYLGI
ncbi:MAG: glycosyltransferase family 2 protein [Ruminococcaceae bacterium]|nr:glycosyltransferase family 2 protein [Oscillospiraceae bacterium]